MKVLMVDSVVGNDYSLCLCSFLQKAGADICLVVPQNREIPDETHFTIKRWAPAKDRSCSKIRKAFRYGIYLVRLLNYIIRNKTEVVHFQFLRRNSQAFMFPFLRVLKKKVVYTAHNVLPHERGRLDFFLNSIIYRSSEMIIVHSQYIRNKLIENFEIENRKIEVIPHGDFDNYLPEKSVSKAEARKNLNLSPEDNVLLFFGFIREYKGLDLLIDAFQMAAEANEQLKLVIAGAPQSKELENRYRAKIGQTSLNGRVVFHCGFISKTEVPVYFEAADIIVLPYKNIDHSGIVHLAYSFGKPVIATKVGDFEEVLEYGKAGFLTERNEAASLANTIRHSFSNRKKLSEMGRFAKELNRTKYSWKSIASRTLGLYQKIGAVQ